MRRNVAESVAFGLIAELHGLTSSCVSDILSIPKNDTGVKWISPEINGFC